MRGAHLRRRIPPQAIALAIGGELFLISDAGGVVKEFSFSAFGMSGVRAGNCGLGVGCVFDSDYASAFCSAGQCEAQ